MSPRNLHSKKKNPTQNQAKNPTKTPSKTKQNKTKIQANTFSLFSKCRLLGFISMSLSSAHIALDAIAFRAFGIFTTTAFTHCRERWSIGNNNHTWAVLYSKWIITLTE